MSILLLVDMEQWSSTRGNTFPEGESINYQWSANAYVLHNMESLIQQIYQWMHICFYNLFNIMGTWNEGQSCKGGMIEKKAKNHSHRICGLITAMINETLIAFELQLLA